jgi:hypothetical protein
LELSYVPSRNAAVTVEKFGILDTLLSYDLAIPLLHVYAREMKMHVYTDLYTNVRAPLFIITKSCKSPKCPPINEWMN